MALTWYSVVSDATTGADSAATAEVSTVSSVRFAGGPDLAGGACVSRKHTHTTVLTQLSSARSLQAPHREKPQAREALRAMTLPWQQPEK